MAIADTGRAIGKVTALLQSSLKSLLTSRYGLEIEVSVGRPEPSKDAGAERRLNLFLYEAAFDGSLKNTPLDEGQQPPLWLVLKYLLTAFDDTGESDTAQAHEYLGEGVRALQELSLLPLTPSTDGALKDNPEALKITFGEISSDLLSKLMQGSDESYRFSLGFEVRPVMIATGEPPSYSLLVGVDYSRSPSEAIGDAGIHVDVFAGFGPRISELKPVSFEPGDTLTIMGTGLDVSGISARLGMATLEITGRKPDMLECKVDAAIEAGQVMSAGSHPVRVVQTLPSGRERPSDILAGRLLPVLKTATVTGPLPVPADNLTSPKWHIDLAGSLLGSDRDDVFVALLQGGKAVKIFDKFAEVTPQTSMRVEIRGSDEVAAGRYRVILRVNGQQARNSPEVELVEA
jgi:hypothetical protein